MGPRAATRLAASGPGRRGLCDRGDASGSGSITAAANSPGSGARRTGTSISLPVRRRLTRPPATRRPGIRVRRPADRDPCGRGRPSAPPGADRPGSRIRRRARQTRATPPAPPSPRYVAQRQRPGGPRGGGPHLPNFGTPPRGARPGGGPGARGAGRAGGGGGTSPEAGPRAARGPPGPPRLPRLRLGGGGGPGARAPGPLRSAPRASRPWPDTRAHPPSRELLDEIAERSGAVVALGERRVELQQRALEQAELRRHFAVGQHLERALDERDRLIDGRAFDAHVPSALAPATAAGGADRDRWADQVLVGDELVAVALQNPARELPAADDEHFLVVLLQLLDQADEVAVAADDDEGVDVRMRERHLERVEREIDVGAVLVAAGRQVALHHLDGVLRQRAAVAAGALPVAVGGLGDDLAALLERLEHEAGVERRAQGVLDANLDVVEVDKTASFSLGSVKGHFSGCRTRASRIC